MSDEHHAAPPWMNSALFTPGIPIELDPNLPEDRPAVLLKFRRGAVLRVRSREVADQVVAEMNRHYPPTPAPAHVPLFSTNHGPGTPESYHNLFEPRPLNEMDVARLERQARDRGDTMVADFIRRCRLRLF